MTKIVTKSLKALINGFYRWLIVTNKSWQLIRRERCCVGNDFSVVFDMSLIMILLI